MRGIDRRERDLTRIIEIIQQLIEGRSNGAGQVTLRAGQTTTTVTSLVIAADSLPQLTPTTANAAAALATTYISAVAQGSFTLTHANAATLDRTFNWQVGR